MIARVRGQNVKGLGDNTTSVSATYTYPVQKNNLLVVAVTKFSPTTDAFVLGDISSSGAATLGSFTLDVTLNYNYNGTAHIHCGIYSAPVTGTGPCTITVSGALAASYLVLALEEYEKADISGTRVADTNTGSGASGAPTTGTVASGRGAVFVGIVGTATAGATTHTPGADFTQIIEEEDGANHMTGSAIDRIVTTDTTDAADWTAPTTVDWGAALAVYKDTEQAPMFRPA